jgi:UDP-N-acetylmuramyl pentapeptide phosphotransferase/UDP-N-acetylglucosamine-1-phosphate transferase
MNILIFLLIVPLFFLLNYFCRKSSFLLDDKSLSHKKKFSKKSVPLLGGVLLISCFIFIFYEKNYYLIFILFSIFFLGLLADINFLKSPFLRFFIQSLIIFVFLYYFNLQLASTKVSFLDFLITSKNINIFFCIFCLMILINGSNFIDGINTLFIINYIAIFLILLFLPKSFYIDYNFIKKIIFILFILYILNSFDLLYLGDNGSYLLSIFTGIFLINFYNSNHSSISSFFIVLLLWYPCFELLFSIIRRVITKKSPFFPDSKHLHHLACKYFEKKFKIKKPASDITTSLFIASYNFLSFSLSLSFIIYSKKIMAIIVINICLYLFIYKVLNKVKNR